MMKDMNTSEVFVTNAGVGDLYEVAAGELAAQRASSDAVRAFGQMMVEHHTTAVHQMRAALMSREVGERLPDLTPVAALDAKRQQMLDQLLAAKDSDFDGLYLEQQRTAHREAAVLLDTYAAQGDNPQLRSLAAGGLPMIQRHLRMLERLGKH